MFITQLCTLTYLRDSLRAADHATAAPLPVSVRRCRAFSLHCALVVRLKACTAVLTKLTEAAHGLQVMDMLSGNLPLPWEGELRPRVAHSLGPFREAVLQLLQRDPDVRSTMQSFHSTCSNLFHCSSSASGAM